MPAGVSAKRGVLVGWLKRRLTAARKDAEIRILALSRRRWTPPGQIAFTPAYRSVEPVPSTPVRVPEPDEPASVKDAFIRLERRLDSLVSLFRLSALANAASVVWVGVPGKSGQLAPSTSEQILFTNSTQRYVAARARVFTAGASTADIYVQGHRGQARTLSLTTVGDVSASFVLGPMESLAILAAGAAGAAIVVAEVSDPLALEKRA